MTGLFVVLMVLAAAPLAAVPLVLSALAGAAMEQPTKLAADEKTVAFILAWQIALIADCVTLGYLAARL